MPGNFEFYRGPAPVDPTPLYQEWIRGAGAGARAAGAALRASIGEAVDDRERRRARRDDREFQAEEARKSREHSRDAQVIAEEAQRSRDANQQRFQAGENAKSRAVTLELSNLERASQTRNAEARTRAELEAEHRKLALTTDASTAENLANAALTTVLNEQSRLPFVKHAKINLRDIFNPNETDDQVLSTLLGANAAARPYLTPEATQRLGEAAKLYTKDQRATIFDPGEGEGNYHATWNHVVNQVHKALGPGAELSEGHMQGIQKALADRLGKLPANEHDAAEGLRESTLKSIQGLFGTAAPAAQQTQSLDKLGMEGAAPGAPQAVTVAPGDLSDDMFARLTGSPAGGARVKELLTQPDPKTGQAAQFVPVPDGQGGVYIAIQGSQLSAQERVALERAINAPGPMREQIQGLMSLGPADATSAEKKQAGAGVRAAPAPTPAPAAAPPRAGGSVLEQFPDLLQFINGQPKR